MIAADAYLAAWRARHPWATCSPRVARMLAELEAMYGCRCAMASPARAGSGRMA